MGIRHFLEILYAESRSILKDLIEAENTDRDKINNVIICVELKPPGYSM